MIDWKFAEGFHPESRVWIYQCGREFSTDETQKINLLILEFVRSWTAHKQELKATGNVLLNRFILLVADETQSTASGCSIDSSVKFIREIEYQFQVSLLDRSKMMFEENGVMKEISLNELEEKILTEEIKSNTCYFNNSITILQELKNNWKIRVRDSWIAGRMKSVLQ